jgi:ankyrin repeat protein
MLSLRNNGNSASRFTPESIVQSTVSRALSNPIIPVVIEDMTVSDMIQPTNISAPVHAPPVFICYKKSSANTTIPKAIRMSFNMVLSHYLHLLPSRNSACGACGTVSHGKNEKAIVNVQTIQDQLNQIESIQLRLILICKLEDDQIASDLLQHYIIHCDDVNRVRDSDHQDCALIHLAAQRNNVLCMELLVDAGANVDCVDAIQATPLFYSTSHNCEEATMFLLSKGANVNTKDIYYSFPLLASIKNQHFKIAELLMLFHADIHQRGPKGCTAAHMVAEQGCCEALKYLIENCTASPFRLTNDEENVLFSGLPNVHCVQYLCSHFEGKDLAKLVSHRNRFGQTVIHRCCDKGYFQSLLIILASLCRDENTRILNERLNEVDTRGRTPLIHSVLNNRCDIVIFLCLCTEVNVEATDRHGNTALHYAIRSNNQDLIYLLLSIGNASKHAKNSDKISCKRLARRMSIDLKKLKTQTQTARSPGTTTTKTKTVSRIPSQLADFFRKKRKSYDYSTGSIAIEDDSITSTGTSDSDVLSSFPSSELILMDQRMKRYGSRFSENLSDTLDIPSGGDEDDSSDSDLDSESQFNEWLGTTNDVDKEP